MSHFLKQIVGILVSTSAVTATAQIKSSGGPELAGLTCDSETMVRLQNFGMSIDSSRSAKSERTYEIKKDGNEYKLILHFSKDDPAIRKAIQEKLAEFRSRCNSEIINRNLGLAPRNVTEPSRSLSDVLPTMKVEVPEVRKTGRLSLDVNPTGMPGGSNGSDKLTTEIVINKSEYEKILEQNSLPLNGMGVRLKFGL